MNCPEIVRHGFRVNLQIVRRMVQGQQFPSERFLFDSPLLAALVNSDRVADTSGQKICQAVHLLRYFLETLVNLVSPNLRGLKAGRSLLPVVEMSLPDDSLALKLLHKRRQNRTLNPCQIVGTGLRAGPAFYMT
ncbi:hypothetical protein BOSEA31B_13884 [Hyphomicrobiales bacterium]|nr:hypothetical protein BOSEA31B_13884 [Hyphomicrobiales bacterium]CAH1699660.1 hypothetical protein BOSEA1005_12713 [Hyphomicrobiales bacterium]